MLRSTQTRAVQAAVSGHARPRSIRAAAAPPLAAVLGVRLRQVDRDHLVRPVRMEPTQLDRVGVERAVGQLEAEDDGPPAVR